MIFSWLICTFKVVNTFLILFRCVQIGPDMHEDWIYVILYAFFKFNFSSKDWCLNTKINLNQI